MKQLQIPTVSLDRQDTYRETHEALWDVETLAAFLAAGAEQVVCAAGNHAEEYFPYGSVRAGIERAAEDAQEKLFEARKAVERLRDRLARCVAERKVAA